MNFAVAVAAVLSTVLATGPAAAAVSIKGIHSSASDESTRIVIDLSGPAPFQYGFVPAAGGKPARVYVDVHDVVLEDQRGQVIGVDDGRVQRVRTGQYKEKVARVVLEVEAGLTPKVLGVEDPPRVVIDLAGPVNAQAKGAPATGTAALAGAASAMKRLDAAPGESRSAGSDQQRLSSAVAAARDAASVAREKTNAPAASTSSTGKSAAQLDLPVMPGRGTGLAPAGGSPPAGTATSSAPSLVAPPVLGRGPSQSSQSSPTHASATAGRGTTQTIAAAPVSRAPGVATTPLPPLMPGRGTALRVLPPPSAGPQVVASATRPARQLRVVIDAGHGGKDPGAKGPAGDEKDAVLDIARRLAAKLKGELNVDVHMTRADDSYVPLDQRKDLANRLEADMFISIHANASRNGKLYGIETYYLKNSNDRATLRLARLENGVDMLIKGGDVSTDADLNYILSDIIQGQKEADSVLLANHIQTQLCDHLETRYDSIRSIGVKQGPFLVLDGTYMPAVLVEAGFITNGAEGLRLRASAYQESVAEGIFRGIKAYLEDERVNDLT
jgi:N-acetylmuramoyl-L-alanine amidase